MINFFVTLHYKKKFLVTLKDHNRSMDTIIHMIKFFFIMIH